MTPNKEINVEDFLVPKLILRVPAQLYRIDPLRNALSKVNREIVIGKQLQTDVNSLLESERGQRRILINLARRKLCIKSLWKESYLYAIGLVQSVEFFDQQSDLALDVSFPAVELNFFIADDP